MKNEYVRPLVIYHANCWDGFCAAWVARKALGDIEAVPAHYGTEPPDVTGRVVYLLDFCYSRAAMERIWRECRRLVVLDHHKTAMEALDGLHEPETGRDVVFDMGRSGGHLAWLWFSMPTYPLHGQSRPWLVDYTEDHDLWRHALYKSEVVNAALRSYPLTFHAWDRLATRTPTDLLPEGEAIRRYQREVIHSHVRNATEIELAGHFVLAVNATSLFSEIAGILAKGRPFGVCYFDRADGQRQWSLRSDTTGLDVSVIAQRFGGGGHPRAAGFQTIGSYRYEARMPVGISLSTVERVSDLLEQAIALLPGRDSDHVR